MTVYADFDCSDCRRFRDVLGEIPGAIWGRIRYLHRHFPMVSSRPRAMQAALAAEAAAAQGRFWPIFDRLFDAGRDREPGSIYRHAEEVGLDVDRFRSDVEGRVYLDRIWEDLRSGRTSGVTGTPAVFVEGRRYQWPDRAETLTADLDRVLAGLD